MELTKKQLIIRLDKLVSILVRLRDPRCATCGKKLLFRNREAGHFISRTVLETRWDLENVNVQCHQCNVEKAGNIPEYRKYIEHKYGLEALKRLDNALLGYQAGSSTKMDTKALLGLYNKLLEQVREKESALGKVFIPKTWK